MFADYTTLQLSELRSLCSDILSLTQENKKRSDSLIVIQHVERELALRQQEQSV